MNAPARNHTPTLTVTGEMTDAAKAVLTVDALQFVGHLVAEFGPRVEPLLEARKTVQEGLRQGKKLHFLPETEHIRKGDWKVAPIPADLQDRRVEITGPTDRKMVINALNSGARVFMADMEDALTPSWNNLMEGQVNLRDAASGKMEYDSPEGKHYALNEKHAVLLVRPRGWHLKEKHVLVDGKPIPGALLDFGLYFFHNAKKLIARGTGPYFYLPKLESYKEAALWSDVFKYAEKALDLPLSTIRATVLIETIPAAFQMEEILHALKEHIVAQNAGRWDYIFSFIKKHSHDPHFVCPDRSQVLMTQPFLRSYSRLLIKTCHKRGALAMGGMAAQIPIKGDAAANDQALARVKADKEREAGDGHDGTWVAHPALVPVAMEVFNRLMPNKNQVDKQLDLTVTAEQLLEVPTGTITEAGMRNNISVALQYIASWLAGNGCVPIFNLMEDAATAEISRTQLWQWIHHKAKMDDGRTVTAEMYKTMLLEELGKIKAAGAPLADEFYARASALLDKIVLSDVYDEFLTLSAYEAIVQAGE